MKKLLFSVLLLISFSVNTLLAQNVPGSIVNYSNPESKIYLGSPSLAILSDGTYVASHDYFGKIEGKTRNGSIFQSKDKGKSWKKTADIEGLFWANLFVHKQNLYLMGCDGEYGNLVIRKSTDGGVNWTEPKDENSGVLRTDFEYHTAAMPM